MNEIQFGIIGLGDIGRGHLKCLLHCKDAKIRAICDIEPKRLNQVGFFGIRKEEIKDIPFFTDYRKVLEIPEIDAIVVAVPSDQHRVIAVEAMAAGRHLLLEKPLAHTLEDVDAIISAQKRYQKRVQVGLVYRYSPFFRKMASIVHGGEIGRVELIWCKEFRQPFPQMDWFYDKKRSGGAIVEKNIHHFDLFQWMIGAKAKKVAAFGGQNVIKHGVPHLINCTYCAEPPKMIQESTIHDNAFVIVEYENGARANLGLCLFLKPGSNSPNHMELGAIGSKGVELMSNVELGLLQVCSGNPKERKDYSMKIEGHEFGHGGTMEEHVEFIESIQKNREPFANLAIAREAFLVSLAAEKSIEEGRVVDLSELR